MTAQRPAQVRCEACETALRVGSRGPLPRFCRSCRQERYEQRVRDEVAAMGPVTNEELAALGVIL